MTSGNEELKEEILEEEILEEEILEEEILEEEILEEEEFDNDLLFEEEEESNLDDVFKEDYDSPEEVNTDINVADDGVKFSELPHLEKIRMASSQNGVNILEPKPSCNDCHGRGYISVKTLEQKILPEDSPYVSATDASEIPEDAYEIIVEEIPTPCKCIFRKEDRNKMFTGNVSMGRDSRRKYEAKEFIQIKRGIHTSGANIEKQRLDKKRKLKKTARNKLKRKHNK